MDAIQSQRCKRRLTRKDTEDDSMQSTVSCDRVFEALTAMPFPAGGDDDARIEDHLRACHDCRRLAEALRPAVNILHESLRDDDSNLKSINRLPSFNGFSDDERAIESIMAEVHASENDQSDFHRPGCQTKEIWTANKLIAWTSLAAAAVIAFVASQNFAGGSPSSFSNDSERFGYLTNCGVPTACLVNAGWNLEPTSGHSDGVDKSCCTKCHNAAPKVCIFDTPNESVPLLAKSCRACHAVSN